MTHNRRRLLATLLLAPLPLSALASALDMFSNRDASNGLKEALTQGATNAVKLLGREDGFLANDRVRIPLPEGLQRAEQVMRMLGRGRDVDELVTAMNRAAEAAVPEARTLLVNAVKSMTVQDAKGILSGGDDSATQYFRGKTENVLVERFLPVVTRITSRLQLAEQYNRIAGQAAGFGLVKPEDANVERYVTRKALDGLYLMIADEERGIRQNPADAVGRLARKVFGAL